MRFKNRAKDLLIKKDIIPLEHLSQKAISRVKSHVARCHSFDRIQEFQFKKGKTNAGKCSCAP